MVQSSGGIAFKLNNGMDANAAMADVARTTSGEHDKDTIRGMRSLKLGNVLVFVQLIFGPRWSTNQP